MFWNLLGNWEKKKMISNDLKDITNTCWRKYICSVLNEKYKAALSHVHLVVHKLMFLEWVQDF
jgi:uncharacterized protein (DUF1919 family)